MHRILGTVFALALSSAFLSGCSTDQSAPLGSVALAPRLATPAAVTAPAVPPATDFVADLTNPYLGFFRGRTFQYRGTTADGVEDNIVEVTHQTKVINGVATTVVHDRVFLNGSLTEDTIDWYAQDKSGNVWYFGEDSKQVQNGVIIGTEGSWQAGVNGALPGIVMLADPRVGVKYQQEFAPGVGEDMAQVKSLTESVTVPYGSFDNCLQTLEWNPLERGPKENKYYALGVGMVLETASGGERDELISVRH